MKLENEKARDAARYKLALDATDRASAAVEATGVDRVLIEHLLDAVKKESEARAHLDLFDVSARLHMDKERRPSRAMPR